MFVSTLYVLGTFCAAVYWLTKATVPANKDASFVEFQRSYMSVYILATGADWIQGPHVYALYQSYGMKAHEIEILFVAGFSSSMLVGTIIGSFADTFGRRSNCILYGILYSCACITKHFPNFWILMIGRVLGGVATSILYSAFESWVVYEHHHLGFDSSSLGVLFSHATLGNSLVAIAAGLISQVVADKFGFVAPFDVSMLVLMVMAIMIACLWKENCGDAGLPLYQTCCAAFTVIRKDRKVLCLGIIQSLFEGAMYTFVLEWTPALSPPIDPTDEVTLAHGNERVTIPHGYVFANFMVAIMIGSCIFKLLLVHLPVESFMRPVLLIAAGSLAMPVLFHGEQMLIFVGFIIFEVCVGIFWPALSTMRGKYVPEEARSTIMNLFRVPLNAVVILILLQVSIYMLSCMLSIVGEDMAMEAFDMDLLHPEIGDITGLDDLLSFKSPVEDSNAEMEWLDGFLDDSTPVLNDRMMTDAVPSPHIKSEHSYSMAEGRCSSAHLQHDRLIDLELHSDNLTAELDVDLPSFPPHLHGKIRRQVIAHGNRAPEMVIKQEPGESKTVTGVCVILHGVP
ncbi:PREDICTED: molybdate-anion transporter-like [Priapulus caudatus]|uniref:Molybdate-anion transporter-like n=1 Tax=Priapulus caudatus TaxID=37621 RepID=A0ABM1EGJ0_PRICU|nr:PREDICTED: molybdate-anion transporter-like [Priapulus caudatus]